MPTISIRDLQIQRREDDLVAASFGRGFFVLDDYSALRELAGDTLEQEAVLFPTRDADYFERGVLGATRKGSQGDQLYVADNPPFGAVLTYHLAEGFMTAEKQRQEQEKAALKDNKAVEFPGWDSVIDEQRETAPALKLVIKNSDGQVIRRIEAPTKKGFHRVAWDLRHPYSGSVETPPNWQGLPPSGFMAIPGQYSAELVLIKDGASRVLDGPVSFAVNRLYEPALKGAPLEEVNAFWTELAQVSGQVSAATYALDDAVEDVEILYKMLAASATSPGDLESTLHQLRQELYVLEEALSGNQSKGSIGAYDEHRITSWLWHAYGGVSDSTYGPTPAHRQSLDNAKTSFAPVRDRLNSIMNEELPAIRRALNERGAPWGRGQAIPAG